MAFVASPELPLHRSLQRVALGEIDHALKRLKSPGRADIHEARKSCRKLRAWLRLLGEVIESRQRTLAARALRVGVPLFTASARSWLRLPGGSSTSELPATSKATTAA